MKDLSLLCNFNMSKIFFYFSIIITLIFLLFIAFLLEKREIKDNFLTKQKLAAISIGNSVLKAEVVNSAANKLRGLGGRKSINDGEGMLFVFSYDDYHGIWMKNVRFPIDIFWLNNDFRIIDFKMAIKPESYPEIFYPREKARFILETGAGFAEKRKIKFDDLVKILR